MPDINTAAAPTPTVNKWEERISSFALAVDKTPEEITNALKTLAGEPGDAALAVLSDPTALTDEDLKGVLVTEGPKIPLGVFRLNLGKLRGPAPVVTMTEERPAGVSYDVLPTVPEDASFLELLKVGGVLKVGPTEVLSAVKAAIANRLGLYDLPEIIKNKMEKFAEEQEEPVGEEYFKLRKLVVSRSYAEILNVLGIEGSFMNDGLKKKFLNRLDEHLWDALQSFNAQLTGWQEAWLAGAANPAAMISMLAMGMGHQGNRGIMPPGMMQPPETAGLHDEAEAVINKINKVFAGTGIPVARALAYDATRIKEVLENKNLPAALGVTNRDQMLKSLGVAVGADYVRLERNITRFTLAVMEFPNITVPSEEHGYLAAMIQLGASIPWDKLGDVPEGTPGRAGLGVPRSGGNGNSRARGEL